MQCEDCKLEQRVIALEKDSERNQETHKGFYTKFEKIAVDSAVTDHKYASIMSAIEGLKATVANLAAKPAKRWETIIAALISAGIGAVVGKLL